MKALKLTGLMVFIAVVCSSCKLGGASNPPTYVHVLNLSFQDASGNSLAQGLERDPVSGGLITDQYVLDILVSERCTNWDNTIYNAPARPGFIPDVNRPRLGMGPLDDGDIYLNSEFAVFVKDCPPQGMLTYKLSCPHVFGDDEIHEIITYWDVPKEPRNSGAYYAKCTRVEFEGQVIIPNNSVSYPLHNNTVTVVLNR